MSDSIITVANLSKRYILGHQRSKDDGIRHAVEDFVRSPLKWARSRRQRPALTREDFWALKDVSFEIPRGSVVGIIGRNGAGKSTLLKILSRITEPTSGEVSLDGRVASLLEVGTGFHPELTGRENVFLNGAILGMHRSEIKKKFDEIVAFAEVEKFLDTPVKRYSSGMYVRLAFAVAAHLEPEVLIVDEVLAVGDAQFQSKCLGKMQDVSSKSGRTVLFVSHNMRTVSSLCSYCYHLDHGQLVNSGATDDVIEKYIQAGDTKQVLARSLVEAPREGNFGRYLKLLSIELVASASDGRIVAGKPLVFKIVAQCFKALPNIFVGIGVNDLHGNRLFTVEGDRQPILNVSPRQIISFQVEIPQPGLRNGRYSVTVGLNSGIVECLDHFADALTFEVVQNPEDLMQTDRPGLGLSLPSRWETESR